MMTTVGVLVCLMTLFSVVKSDCQVTVLTVKDTGETESDLVPDMELMEGEKHEVLNGASLTCQNQILKACHRGICITIGKDCRTVYIDEYDNKGPSCQPSKVTKLGSNGFVLGQDDKNKKEIIKELEDPEVPPLEFH